VGSKAIPEQKIIEATILQAFSTVIFDEMKDITRL
jgi:hypothetical protein